MCEEYVEKMNRDGRVWKCSPVGVNDDLKLSPMGQEIMHMVTILSYLVQALLRVIIVRDILF